MNKRWISILLAACLMLGLMGCRTTDISGGDPTADLLPDSTSGSEASSTTGEGPQDLDNATGPNEGNTQTDPSGEASQPTDTSTEPSHGASDPTEDATEPSGGQDSTEDPSEPSGGEEDSDITDYEMYHNMSGAEQKAFIDSFDSIEAFFVWYNNAKAEYEAKNPGIDVGNGNVDLGGND